MWYIVYNKKIFANECEELESSTALKCSVMLI